MLANLWEQRVVFVCTLIKLTLFDTNYACTCHNFFFFCNTIKKSNTMKNLKISYD